MGPGNLKTLAELREAVRREPLDPALHHALGSALQDAGEHSRAISAYQKALRLDASNAAVMNDLGTAYYARGDRPSAERWFREALAADPHSYSACENLGSALRAQGKLAEARRALQKALWLRITRPFRRSRPATARPAPAGQSEAQRHFVAALTAYSNGRKAEALEACGRALHADDDHAEALHLQGMLLGGQGRYDEAIGPLRRAIELQPAVAEFHITLGNVLKSQGERKAAVGSYERAVQVNPASAAAYCNIASVYLEVQDYEAGLHWANLCIGANSGFAQGHLNLGLAHHGLGRYPEAETALRRALELDPAIVRCHCLLAQALREQGRLAEAEECLRRALAAEPDDPLVHLTAGAFYHECKADTGKAREFLARALEIAPQDSRAHFNGALLDLQEGRFSSDTWLRYESRKKQLERDLAYKKIPLPDWDGRPLGARRLLLYGEQGVGDEIMFASMVPDVLRTVAQPVLACDPRLVPLFSRSFPQAVVVPWNRTALAESADEMKQTQFACALGSLGQFYRTGPDAFPRTPYLKPDEQKVARWRERLAHLGPGPKIGLAWRGGVPNSGRGRRSLSFDGLRAAVPDSVRLVSLQRDPDEAERAAMRTAGVAHWPEALADPDETAALICALDLIATVCSWIVHLAGALGRPALVSTPLVPEWRYGSSGEAMIWYPSIRLLRAQRFGEWAAVLEAIRHDLELRFGTSPLPGRPPAPAAPTVDDHLKLAARHHDEGKLDRAIISYRRALALDDARAETYNDLGIAYYAKGFLDDAVKNFRESIARDPKHEVAHANLGAALRRQGKLREARLAYQAALAIKLRKWWGRWLPFGR